MSFIHEWMDLVSSLSVLSSKEVDHLEFDAVPQSMPTLNWNSLIPVITSHVLGTNLVTAISPLLLINHCDRL